MTSEIQQYAVIAVVAVAAAYVMWSMIAQFRARGKSCGGSCSGCGSSEKALGEPKGFVGIEQLSQPKR